MTRCGGAPWQLLATPRRAPVQRRLCVRIAAIGPFGVNWSRPAPESPCADSDEHCHVAWSHFVQTHVQDAPAQQPARLRRALPPAPVGTVGRAAAASAQRAPDERWPSRSLRNGSDAPLVPVYRAAPFLQEEERRARGPSGVVRVLFASEGNICRSVLAEAIFSNMLRATPLAGIVQVDSKALSPHTSGEPPHPRAAAVARELGLRLRVDKVAVPFDEGIDIVNHDLVVVMDRFDQEALLRELAVFDALNPGGCYCARVRRLGEWAPLPRPNAAAATNTLHAPTRSLRGDIADPLYGNLGGEAETAAIWAAVRLIRAGCRGLLHQLMELAHDAGVLCDDALARAEPSGDGASRPEQLHFCAVQPHDGPAEALAAAIEASLHCPLWTGDGDETGVAADGVAGASQGSAATAEGGRAPVWKEGGVLFTVRYVRSPDEAGPGTQVDVPLVRVPVRYEPRDAFENDGYWTDLRNVRPELLSWIETHDAPANVMPTLRALRDSGAHALELAVRRHGGPDKVAEALGLRPVRGNYVTWEALWADVKQLIADAGLPPGIMPARRVFVAARRIDLYSAMVKFGGVAAVARRAGLVYRKGPLGQRYRSPALLSLSDVRKQLDALAAAGVCAPGEVPSCKQLSDAGLQGLYVRLCSIAGGMAPLAKLLGMRYDGRLCRRRSAAPELVLASRDALEADLRVFVQALEPARSRRAAAVSVAEPPMLPSRRAMVDAGREDLWEAILTSGGRHAVAQRLGWRVTSRGRPRGTSHALD